MVLVCLVIQQDHVIKWSFYFVGRSLSRKVIILPSLVDIGTLVVEMFLVCHAILHVHVIKSSGSFICRTLSWYVTILSSLVAIDIVVDILQDHVMKGSNNMGRISSSFIVWRRQALWQWKYVFSLTHDLDIMHHQHLLDQSLLGQFLYMYLLAKLGGHRSYGNGDIKYINSYTKNSPQFLHE